MSPVRHIPPGLLDRFTMGGRIPVVDYYFNDHPDHSAKYTKENIDKLVERAKNRETLCYENTEQWLYALLDRHPIEGKTVLIVGSEIPTYESIVLARGGKPVVIEYGKIVSDHPGIRYMTVEEAAAEQIVCDAGMSISSFEHTGLGRYGDPIDPDGDLVAMQDMKEIVRKGGLMFLAVPLGRDTICWNGMRQYGALRFPLLTAGWYRIDSEGFEPMDLFKEYGTYLSSGQVRYFYHQPVFVLENK